ncbi:MAG: hypothetical protein ACI33P_09475 [Lysinibacillus sp.]
MKYIKILIGILIILIGSTLLSITVYDEPFKTARLNITEAFILLVGAFILHITFKRKKQQ